MVQHRIKGSRVPDKRKPIDRWLTLAGLALAIVLFLLPKSAATVGVLLTSVFVLLFHAVWNFWWIEKRILTRIAAVLVFAGVLCGFGYKVWPGNEHGTPEQPRLAAPMTSSAGLHAALSNANLPVLSKYGSNPPRKPALASQHSAAGASVRRTPRVQKRIAQRPVVLNAPNGIAIAGGTVINPTVNNGVSFFPVQPSKITYSVTHIDDHSSHPQVFTITIHFSAPASRPMFLFACNAAIYDFSPSSSTGYLLSGVVEGVAVYGIPKEYWRTLGVGMPDPMEGGQVIYARIRTNSASLCVPALLMTNPVRGVPLSRVP